MPTVRPGVRRLFDLMLRRRDRTGRDVEAEVALHLDLRTAQLRAMGVPDVDAAAEARRRFGSLELGLNHLERTAHRRDRRMGFRELAESALQDARYAFRGLRREPLFTGFAVVTLALGIGANAAVYGVVDRLLIHGPEHVVDPDGMVRMTTTVTDDGIGEVTFGSYGYVMYTTLRDNATAFDGVAGYADGNVLLGQGRSAQSIHAGFATADFFPLLGVRPQLGRFYQQDEDDPAGASKVIVLGDALWRTRFGAEAGIIGQDVDLSDGKYTVIGVAPAGFTGVELERIDAWLPMTLYSQGVTQNWQTAWNAQWLRIVARLKDGVTRAAAGAEATRALRGAYDGSPTGTFSEARLGTVPLHYTTDGTEANEASVSRWLLGVTAIVLLIACTNVSNLLLARAVRRRGEVGVRLALGAARARLARLFFTESLVLALLGGAVALLVAGALSITIRQSLLANIEWTTAPVSGRVVAVSLGVSLVVGLLVGLAPSIHAARGSLMSAIQRGHASGRRMGLGAWPTVLQAGLTATLLIGAGIFSLSFYRARHVPLGFESDRVLVAQAQFTPFGDVDSVTRAAAVARRNETWRRGLERVRSMPGTEHAALAAGLPFGSTFKIPLFVPGWDSLPRIPGGGPYVAAVTSDYFATVGTRVLRGREFTETEREGTDRVAIVNQTMATTLWPDGDAIGRCVHMWERSSPCSQVVGVVEDARRYELREEPTMQYYIPLGQNQGFGGTVLVARPRSTPAAIAAAVASMLEGLDATIERAVARPIRADIDPILRPWRLGATIFGLGGVLALLVAALGLYSVMSYAVAQRSHELGVRIALGATSRRIVRMVMRQSLVMAMAGLVGGLLVALYAGRRVEGLLFETSVREPAVIVTTVVVLVITALVASYVPARRARSVDPMRALRAD